MLRWGKEHVIGLVLGVLAYEFYTRRKGTAPGGASQ